MAENQPTRTAGAVDIEAIMQDVREEILSRGTPGQAKRPPGPRTLSPDFYEHLYRAGLAQKELTIQPPIVKSSAPLIGPLLDFVRKQFHQLVAYYFDHLAYRQSEINHHLWQALNHIDGPPEPDAAAGSLARVAARSGLAGRADGAASAEDVYACYRLLLDREPDAAEWTRWQEQLAGRSLSRRELVDSFLNGAEFIARTQSGA